MKIKYRRAKLFKINFVKINHNIHYLIIIYLFSFQTRISNLQYYYSNDKSHNVNKVKVPL